MKPINVLSLFDGISCGRVALERAGIEVESYLASETDKYAIQVSQNNFGDIIHVGDVKNFKLTHYKTDLLIGGSPCQGFSRAGKQENFEDPRSKLFYEYVRILKETRPKYLILENVRMKPEFERKITQYLDWVEPILINSSLVSAQNRERLYWVGELQENGKYMTVNIPQPEDKKLSLKDVIQPPEEVEEKYYLSEKILEGFFNKKGDFKDRFKISCLSGKGACLTAKSQGSVITQTYIIQIPRGKNEGGIHTYKSPTITSNLWQYNNLLMQGGKVRRLTPIECERLQTLPDNYTACVSNSQRYKQLGNGWTIDVIAHILSHLKF